MDIVKYSLNNKLKKLMKINIDLEGEIQDLKQFSETNRMIKEILIKQKNEVEIKYNYCISQIINYQLDLKVKYFLYFHCKFFQNKSNKLNEINDKYNKIESEYENFKNKLVKEYKILKNQYDIACDERDTVKDALFEFKNYFSRFNITEEGDIMYVEEY